MSSTVTATSTWPARAVDYRFWNESVVQDTTIEPREHAGMLSIYPIFLSVTVMLSLFFAVSLVLTLTTHYFLDLGSAIIGLLGSTGLALVGWFSKRQVRS